MTEEATVLVTAAGTVVAQGVMKCLRLASSQSRPAVKYRILAVDMSPQAAGIYRADAGFIVPAAGSPRYLDDIIRICRRERVRAVYCGSDEELRVLAGGRERIRSESGATVIINADEVISVGSDKWATYRKLEREGIPCAESSLPSDMKGFIDRNGLPVVVKPRRGHGSLGFFLAKTRREAAEAAERLRRAGTPAVIQEYLSEGENEFTTGVTSGLEGSIISSIAMRRTLKSGQTGKAFVEDFPVVRKAAERVALAIGSIGPLNVQSRLADGVPKVFEVNPRFSASCAIRAVAGVNEPDMLFRSWVLGQGVRSGRPRELVAFRYWNEVYVPRESYEKVRSAGRASPDHSSIPDYF